MDKLKAAKKRPAKPAFIINNSQDKLKLNDIWKVVSSKIPNPKLDGCRKLASGDYVLTTSDANTAEAIRHINEGLSIRETAPRWRRCLQTDHKTTDCKAETSTCFHCAKPGHNKNDCPEKNEKLCCAHSGGNHTTLSKDYANWVVRTMALQVKTNYECT